MTAPALAAEVSRQIARGILAPVAIAIAFGIIVGAGFTYLIVT